MPASIKNKFDNDARMAVSSTTVKRKGIMVQETLKESAAEDDSLERICKGGGGVAPDSWIRPSEELCGQFVIASGSGHVVTGVRCMPESEDYSSLSIKQLKARLDIAEVKRPGRATKDALVKLVRGLEDYRLRWLVLRCVSDGFEYKVELDCPCRCYCFPRYATADEVAKAQAEWGVRTAKDGELDGGVRKQKGYASGGITDKVLEILSDGKEHRILIMADKQLEVRRSRVRSAIKTLQRHGRVIVKISPGTFQMKD